MFCEHHCQVATLLESSACLALTELVLRVDLFIILCGFAPSAASGEMEKYGNENAMEIL